MKLLKNIIFIFLIIAFSSCKSTFFNNGKSISQQAADYNDLIINQQIAIVGTIDILAESFKEYIPEKMDEALNNAINQTNKSIEYLNGLENFYKNSEFKDGALILFNVYKSVLEYEYKEMVEIYKLSDMEFTEEHSKKFDEFSALANYRTDIAFKEFVDIQDKFAKKYELILY